MRRFVPVLLIIALVFSFTSVLAQEDLSGVDPSGQTVLYWHQYNGGAQQETMNALVEQFNSTNEYGITVEAVAIGNYNDLRDQMNAAIVSGELPNLVAGYQSDALSYYGDDAVVDLNALFTDPTWGFTEEEAASLNQSIFDVNLFASLDGARLAFPNQVSANVLAVNKTMLAELGFDAAPTTAEDFEAISCAAAEAEATEGFPIVADASQFESLVASFGGSIFADGAYTFTNDAVIQVLELYKSMYDAGCAYIPEAQFGNTADFAVGLNPMAMTSTAGIPFISGDMAEAGYEAEWEVTVTPFTEGNKTLQVYVPSIIMVPSTPEQEVASWLFLKFLATPESQVTWASATGYFPINTAAVDQLGDYASTNPFFAQANGLLNDPEVKIYSAPSEESYNAVRGLVGEAIADITTNGRDVAEVAAELEVEANAVHAEMAG
jgi:multiple sugar transport system substrate-binding protein